ncbi:ABC transporter substrate-binding protein [Bradyrhizobium sp. Ash2021]|uniref:ABC transporter substrate-binding protein n=1 Tax=Bradyrhizobium sp. Ash2021 TaxID=2954771 RepID=UPI002815BFAD|nr:ABC transporter substrate-binding protein [Bradyrhizobium sp. Ash2021]WMT73333.1 ABC transporter substrate-binding protein [Bradyrhizobium sp. Ash2021]
MKRREFITLIGALAMTPPSAAFAEQGQGRVPRIAYLGASSPRVIDPRQLEGFKQGMRENGLIEGENVVVDYIWTEGDAVRLSRLAGDVSKGGYDAVVTAGPQAVHALTRAGTTAPIVFAIVGDAIANGVVTSLARPSGNVTGLSMSNSDLESKRIEILKEAAPSVTHVMALRYPSMGESGLKEAAATAKALGVEFDAVEAGVDQFDAAFADAVRRGVNGLATFASPFFNFQRVRLIELATRHRLPSIWESDGYVRDGGLLSYGPNFPDMYRRSAGYVAKILKGAKPSGLPVEQPVRFELTVNLKTARELGIILPPTLLARADEVIE